MVKDRHKEHTVCIKCNQVYLDGYRHCPHCGQKTENISKLKSSAIEKKLKKHKDEKSKKNKEHTKIISGDKIVLYTLLPLFIVALIALPTTSRSYSVDVPYEDIEYYTEQETYEVEEPYQKQMPYQTTETYIDTVPVEKSVPYTDYEQQTWNEEENYCDQSQYCACINTHWFWGYCIECFCSRTIPVTKYKNAIEQQKIQKERPVTKYKMITEYKTVTKYRDVQKSRTVTKFRTEERQEEVNWIFQELRIPWRFHLHGN